MSLADQAPVAETYPDLVITPELVIPRVDTDVFDGHDDARLWLGIVATPVVTGPEFPEPPKLTEEFRASRILRANVYIDEKSYLPESARQADGGESDLDDARSTQLVVIENGEAVDRLVGTSRLILKRDESDLLPVERLFPEAFVDEPASAGSVEASRYIARHEDRMTQRVISLGLMRTMSAYAHAESSEYIYAVIEEHLARLFRLVGMPFEQIADAKPVPEYDNTVNMAVRFDPKEIFAAIDRDVSKEKIISTYFEDALESLGLGYYDETMMGRPASTQ